MTRLQLFFRGRVQGVGFRYTTLQISREFDVTGFVRNLPDKRVELVAEGERGEVGSFVGRIHEELGANITGTDEERSKPTGEFHNFEIRK